MAQCSVSDRQIPAAVAVPGMGERIRCARMFRQLNQAEVARRLGVTASAVNQWEKGSTEPHIGSMLAFRRETGISLDWLYAKDWEAVRGPFMGFLVQLGAAPDAPDVAREARAMFGLPVTLRSSDVPADDVAEAILRRHPPRRRRAPRPTLHEDQDKPGD